MSSQPVSRKTPARQGQPAHARARGGRRPVPTSGEATPFDAHEFLESAAVPRRVVEFQKNATLCAQGDAADTVMYIQKGRVKLSVVSSVGKEAVIVVLGPGEFLGEGCLAGQPVRMGTARAVAEASVALSWL